jgi:hypothetical protein
MRRTFANHPAAMKGTNTMRQPYYSPDDPREATMAQEAKAERDRIMDSTIEKYIAVARHCSLEELAEVSGAIDRLHHQHAEAIAQKHREDAEALSKRTWRRGHLC